MQPQTRYLLSLSVLPNGEEDSLEVKWYLDGIAHASYRVENVGLQGMVKEGVTIVGGTNGFAGVMDELGVFYRDGEGNYTVDPTLR
jgi:hypothetical protein